MKYLSSKGFTCYNYFPSGQCFFIVDSTTTYQWHWLTARSDFQHSILFYFYSWSDDKLFIHLTTKGPTTWLLIVEHTLLAFSSDTIHGKRKMLYFTVLNWLVLLSHLQQPDKITILCLDHCDETDGLSPPLCLSQHYSHLPLFCLSSASCTYWNHQHAPILWFHYISIFVFDTPDSE